MAWVAAALATVLVFATLTVAVLGHDVSAFFARICRGEVRRATGAVGVGWPIAQAQAPVLAAVLRRTATLHRRPGRSLLAGPAHARQATRRSSPERTARAIAGSRNVCTGKAHQPALLCTPRGLRARTDHTSHSSPASCRSTASSQSPVNTEEPPSPPDTGPPQRVARSAPEQPCKQAHCANAPISRPGRRGMIGSC